MLGRARGNANGCRPRRPTYLDANMPCFPNRMGKRSEIMENALRAHDMNNNPEIRSSVEFIDQATRGPRFHKKAYDRQENDMANPRYYKWHRQAKTGNSPYPVHYSITAVDYRTYLLQQKERMRKMHGADFEDKCYMSSRDIKRLRHYEDFYKRNPVKKTPGVCHNCNAAKNDVTSKPHCCACRNDYYEKLGWQNVNSDVKQGVKSEDIKESKSSHLRSLIMKKSSLCQESSKRSTSRTKSKEEEYDDGFEDVDKVEECPCGPYNSQVRRSWPVSEYQAAYQYEWSHSCSKSKESSRDQKENWVDDREGVNHKLKARQPWDPSTKPNNDFKLPKLLPVKKPECCSKDSIRKLIAAFE